MYYALFRAVEEHLGVESYAVMGTATLVCLVACVKVHSVLQGLATHVAVQVFSKAAGNVSTVGDGGKVRRNGYLSGEGGGIRYSKKRRS